MALARFLQVSDLHLGAPFRWLPADRREARRRDQRTVLERAVRQAIERGVDAILLPGDLFDQEGTDAATLAFALGVFDVPGCPPVLIAPGNHDPYSDQSLCWSERLLRARGMSWPAHVQVFSTPSFSPRPLARHASVRVWGRCFVTNVESQERPLDRATLATLPPIDPSGFELALFHGSREGQLPAGQKMTAPFSDEEVVAGPFAYHAVGHYHTQSRLEQTQGTSAGVRLAYAGSAAAVNATETGAHGALEVRIEYGRRLPFVETEFVELDPRRVHDLTVEIAQATSPEQVERRVLKAMADAGARDEDIVTVRLTGRLTRGVRFDEPGPELRARAFFLRFDKRRLKPDYNLEAYRVGEPTTTEERFARQLLGQLDQEADPEKRAVIESALYYGLDAFRLREVVPAYEEVGE